MLLLLVKQTEVQSQQKLLKRKQIFHKGNIKSHPQAEQVSEQKTLKKKFWFKKSEVILSLCVPDSNRGWFKLTKLIISDRKAN
jgi:hypothetical protein